LKVALFTPKRRLNRVLLNVKAFCTRSDWISIAKKGKKQGLTEDTDFWIMPQY